jgi:hypothetical protein
VGPVGHSPVRPSALLCPELQRCDYRRRARQLEGRRPEYRTDTPQRGHRPDRRDDGVGARRRVFVPEPVARPLRGHRDEGRVPAGGPAEHRRDPQLESTARRRAASRHADRTGGSRGRIVGAQYDRHPGARHHARDAGSAAADLRQRPALLRDVRHSDAGCEHRRARQRVRRAHQRRPAVGRRSNGRRRQHAAGLHEPGRHGVDLPGLPDVSGHGQRGQGPDVELRPGIRLVAVRSDHGGDEVGRQCLPRGGVRVPPRRRAERHPVGSGREGGAEEEQLRRERRRPRQGAAALVGSRQELLLFQLRRVSAGGRIEPADALDPVGCRTQRRLQRLARLGGQPDPHLRSGNASSESGRHRLHQGSVHGLQRQPAERDLSIAHQPAGPAVAAGTAGTDRRRTVEQLPRPGDPRHDSRQFRLLHGAVRRAGGRQRPRVPQRLASAGPRQVRLHAAADDRQRDVFGSAELVGQPLQLRPDLLEQSPEPHVDGVLESQRGVRLGQRAIRRRLSEDRRRRRLQRPADVHLQRRLRAVRQQRRRQRGQHHDASDVHHQRHGDLDARSPHRQVRDGVPQGDGKHPRE